MKKSKELAEALIEMLEENLKMHVKIGKVCTLLEEFDYKKNSKEDIMEFISYIIYYLENEIDDNENTEDEDDE